MRNLILFFFKQWLKLNHKHIKALPWLLVLLPFTQLNAQSKVILSDWEFRNAKENQWFKANVPGNVHTDLMNNQIIPDPFFASNEQQLKWIEETTWEYRTYFKFDGQHDSILLNLDGLDTYAQVFINNRRVLIADNMFVHHRVTLNKTALMMGANELKIVFTPVKEQDEARKKAMGLELPGAYAYSRKAAYEYGWDWGPRLLTCGIWKKVYLSYYSVPEVTHCNIIQRKVNNEMANLDLHLNMRLLSTMPYQISIIDIENKSTLLVKDISGRRNQDETKIVTDSLTVSFVILEPKLWWCRGYGAAYRYHLKISITFEDGTIPFDTIIHLGLRSIELVQDVDKEGKTFYFRLNGVPVFCKGANMIPVHSFASNESEKQYKRVVDDALAVNMNMLRVWGGGFYPGNSFYDYCDEKGVMIWQDLMFACSVYPDDEAFVHNVKTEVKQQVERIGSHACIALWCGNNEVTEGWQNWGWQKQFHYSTKDSSRIWLANKKLFEQTIPDIIHGEQPESNYHASSPAIGWGHDEAMKSGDMHYWGVWWGLAPFEKYGSHTGRFMSEYGFQSLPEMNSIRKFISPDSLVLGASQLKNHQKHPTGFETINTYLSRVAVPPSDLEKYSYFSQWIQADGMRTAIESHRRKMPYCMGTLYWQLNDCWPAISWSSVDYYGNWKKFHFDLRRLYATFLISPTFEADTLRVFVVSDSIHSTEALLTMQCKDINGEVYYESVDTLKLSPLNSQLVFTKAQHLLKLNKADYLYFTLTSKEKVIATSMMPLDERNLITALQPPNLTTSIVSENDAHYLLIKNQGSLIQSAFVQFDNDQCKLEENFFDLQAGESKKITILGNYKPSNVLFHVISMYDIKPRK